MIYMNKRQAPRINAAVPVHTPLNDALAAFSEPDFVDLHQPLQRPKFNTVHPLFEACNFLLDS